IPISSTLAPATAALEAAMSSLHWSINGIELLQNAFQTASIVLAEGMAVSSFVGIPPPLPPEFILTGLITGDALIEATNIAGVLWNWAHTGTATPISGGPPINWT